MRRRRYRTIQVDRLDRLMAESEAIARALEAGCKRASVYRAQLVPGPSGRLVWEIVLRIVPQRGTTGVSSR